MKQILIVIPAYEPDERLLLLLTNIQENNVGFVILVNDGSGSEYTGIFNKAADILKDGGVLLVHEVNRGKGRALKTAFSYVLNNYTDAVGVVTADSDGQHTVEAIKRIKAVFTEKPESLVLGVRDFSGKGIPWKSRFGNNLTEKVFQYLSGIHVSDTQTGLRGIPKSFMQQLLAVKGERFEFEMRMLLECAGRYSVTEVPIETIYDSEENHQTHFNPVMDSIRIYRILGEKFIRYVFASFSSSIIDVVMFTVLCILLKSHFPYIYIVLATVLARIISATYNYIMNYKLVFQSKEPVKTAGVKYAVLAVVQMSLSAILVTLIVNVFLFVPEFVIKVAVDIVLFFISYYVQQRYIFL